MVPVPFNNADALDARLAELAGEVACVIMEPGMMNIGVVLPEPGYLEEVREITQRHNVILIFDEVKTGITIPEGGAGALRRHARHRDAREGDRRRRAERRDRRQRGGHGVHRETAPSTRSARSTATR